MAAPAPWFEDAKLGIFIHWGIYAVKGVPESWSLFSGQVPRDEYIAQAQGFSASAYDPEAWAALFEEAGARYVVLTTKHHDGFALWDTAENDWSAPKASPAGRDLLTPYCEALRRHDLKVGLYFSHLDWLHPDYASVRPGGDQPYRDLSNPFAYPQGPDDPEAWERFLRFHRAQLHELCHQFGKVDLLWFDGDWERDASQWRWDEIIPKLREWQPGVTINSRAQGHGDYATPEQGIPVTRPEGPWELCLTVNDSWGYQVGDDRHKSLRQILFFFTECIAMGGNLLLDIGPHADGSLQAPQVEVLRGLGRWVRKHAEAIYGTREGIGRLHFEGPSTLSPDRTRLYLFVMNRPHGEVYLKGISSKVHSARVVGSGEELGFGPVGVDFGHIPSVLSVRIPDSALDADGTVVALEFEEPLQLYTGAGRD